jgi:hypothetical protein
VITLIIFLALSAGLLILMLFALSRRAAPAEGSWQALLDARLALSALQQDLLTGAVVQRVFAKEDLEYIVRATPEPVHKLFIDERRKVALIWVRLVRRGVEDLKAFHLGQARHYARLKLRTELALALNFTSLLLACRALEIALYLRGPYAVPGFVGMTVRVAGRLCEASEKSLAFLSSTGQAGLHDGRAGGQAAV